MKIEASTVQKLEITETHCLGTIQVYFESRCQGTGQVIIECEGNFWSANLAEMGGFEAHEVFLVSSKNRLFELLNSGSRASKERLSLVIDATKEGLNMAVDQGLIQ